MKILVCHPGPEYSVSDVYDGLVSALERAGHEVIKYALGGRISFSRSFLKHIWLKDKRKPRPTDMDALYWASQGVLERALRFEVDWTIVVSALLIHPEFLILMRRAGQKVAVVFTESPYLDDQQAALLPLVDAAFTNERTSVDVLRKANPNVHYLPCAYDSKKHRADLPIDETFPAHDVVFVGTAGRDFPERTALLEAVDWSGIDLGLYGNWSGLRKSSPLRAYLRGGIIPNAHAVGLYRRAKIGLNLYRKADGAESLNPRALELAACGAFTVSEYRREVEEVFGRMCPTFRTPDELGQALRYWLADDAGRSAVKQALPSLVEGRSFDAAALPIVDHLNASADSRRIRCKHHQEVS